MRLDNLLWPMMQAEAGTDSGGSGDAGAGASSGTADSGAQNGGTLLSGNLMDWRQSLPENLRDAGVIKQLQTTEAAAKTLVSQAEMIGRGVFLPKAEPGTPEYTDGMQKVFAKLGRPDVADSYAFKHAEGRTIDSETEGTWKKAFHALGLSQDQAQGVMDEYWRTVNRVENIKAGQDARSFDEGRKRLYAEFGASTEEVMAKAQDFFNFFGRGAYGGEAGRVAWQHIQDAILPDGSRLVNTPEFIVAFAQARDRLSEGEFRDSDVHMAVGTTIATLTDRARELTTKRNNGTITTQEAAELQKAVRTLAAQQERDRSRGALSR